MNYIRDALDRTFGPAKAAPTAPEQTQQQQQQQNTGFSGAHTQANVDKVTNTGQNAMNQQKADTGAEDLAKAIKTQQDAVTESASVKFTRKFAKFLDNQG